MGVGECGAKEAKEGWCGRGGGRQKNWQGNGQAVVVTPLIPLTNYSLVKAWVFTPRAIIVQLQIQNCVARKNLFELQVDVWECLQRIPHCRYRFVLEPEVITTTDTDFSHQMNWFCTNSRSNGIIGVEQRNCWRIRVCLGFDICIYPWSENSC